MKNGIVFDIKELSIYDGPGVRVTVFMKGCPLRCKWCHNPEGLSPSPQVMLSYSICTDCGSCLIPDCELTGGKSRFLQSEKACNGCGKCIPKCPNAYRRLAGTEYSAQELADIIMKNSVFFENGGGVTFSGGEPTMQWEFINAVMDLLPIHKAIQTCGYCDTAKFQSVLQRVDFLFFDIKIADPQAHKLYTGKDNSLILENLQRVKDSGIPFVVRIPLIKNVNDSLDNLEKTAALIEDAKNLERIELLPYSPLAAAKYEMTGQIYGQSFSSPDTVDVSPFVKRGLKWQIMKGSSSIRAVNA